LYCLSFSFGLCIYEKDRQYNDQKKKTDNTMNKRKRQTIQRPKEKDRQYNDQKKKTDNTMIKRKRQTIQWPKEKDRQYNG
jgi:hypothetical protein